MAEISVKTVDSSFPTIFSDGVLNLANSHNMVKFYLVRFDPDIRDQRPGQTTVVAQVVMPIDSFVKYFAFFGKCTPQVAGRRVNFRA